MRNTLIFFSLLLPCSLFGQDLAGYVYQNILNDMINPSEHLMRERMSGRAYGTNGNPYVFEEFTPGTVYFSNKMKSPIWQINYNCYTNEILYSDGTNEYLLDSRKIDFLEFEPYENTSVIFRQVFLEDKKMSQFLQVLYHGQSVLYKRHYREYLEADYGGAYSADRRYNEYKDLYDYYISFDNIEAVSFKPNKKNLLNIMHLHEQEIESFLKTEKIDLKSDEGLARVVKYYDSLSTPSQ